MGWEFIRPCSKRVMNKSCALSFSSESGSLLKQLSEFWWSQLIVSSTGDKNNQK